MATAKNGLPKSLKQIEEEVRAERPTRKKTPRGQRKRKAEGRKVLDAKTYKNTSIAKDARAGKRKPPPVPDADLETIKAMDPEDKAFRHPQGRKRKYDGKDKEELSWTESVKQDKQARQNKRRAKARKHEAVVVKAVQERGVVRGSVDNPSENQLYSDKTLDFDDWDAEELIRGYRRDRSGRFGKPPKYIPREVQQECFKRLVRLGEKDLRGAYLGAIQELVKLATSPDTSEKVKLDAIREVMDRTAGKVPEHLKIGTDAPWMDMLADSVQPLVERTTLEIEGHRYTEELGDGDDDSSGRELAAGSVGAAESMTPSSSPDSDIIDAEIVELDDARPAKKKKRA